MSLLVFFAVHSIWPHTAIWGRYQVIENCGAYKHASFWMCAKDLTASVLNVCVCVCQLAWKTLEDWSTFYLCTFECATCTQVCTYALGTDLPTKFTGHPWAPVLSLQITLNWTCHLKCKKQKIYMDKALESERSQNIIWHWPNSCIWTSSGVVPFCLGLASSFHANCHWTVSQW